MATAILVILLIVAAFFAAKTMKKHFAGQSSCCGGGSSMGDEKIVTKTKVLTDPVIGTKSITIEGMMCEKCQARVENRLNKIYGASAKVNLEKKVAILSMTRQIGDDEIYAALKDSDYKIVSIL